MSYYTDYTLSFIHNDAGAVLEELSNISGYTWDRNEKYQVKWYSHVRDMLKLSECFPDTMFLLEGQGEESGDVWKYYCKAGKHYKVRPILTWPEFNEAFMQ